MKVMLIAPSSGRWHGIGRRRLCNGRTFRFSLLSLLTVAAETPAGIEITLVDEQVEDIPPDARPDLVGITCMTATAPRAYEIARMFRARGTPVVLGGMHPTLCAEEALQHADAIVIGDAEGVWPRVVADARAGRLQRRYRSPRPPSLAGLRRPPQHLLPRARYATVRAVQATRGCPSACRFCAVSAFHGGAQRRRPVPEVISELAAAPDRFVIFVDDNLTADRAYAAQLFRALAPLRKRWVAQSTLAIADDPAFLDLAARAGCVGLFVGLETFSQESLDEAAKTTHRAAACRAAVAALHARGIAVEAGVVFGFDSDTPAVFERTLRELDRAGIDLVQISILTPLPGTPQFDAMRARLTDGDWSHYDFHHVVFRPLRMTPEALQAGHDWATREFYRPWHILRRLARHACRPRGFGTLPYLAALSFAYCGRIASWGIRGWNPAAAKAANTQPCAEGAGCAICDGRMRLPRAMVNREVAHASLCTSTPAGFLRLAQRHAIPGGYERQPVQAPGGFHARDAHGRSS